MPVTDFKLDSSGSDSKAEGSWLTHGHWPGTEWIIRVTGSPGWQRGSLPARAPARRRDPGPKSRSTAAASLSGGQAAAVTLARHGQSARPGARPQVERLAVPVTVTVIRTVTVMRAGSEHQSESGTRRD